ncbi:MAG: M14 family metallopeptidase [Candidatus Eremiobacteraeota bacterium]|nr:M14 family metallopeptidase [Candidatus Eremiobacteraeota bacterium]
MNSSPISPSGGPQNVSGFKYVDGEGIKDVHPSKIDIADKIDLNKNGVIDDRELRDYLKKQDILRDPEKCSVDEEKIIREFKDHLENKPLAQAKAYHTYDQAVEEMKALADKRPDLCKMESVGKSAEGKDIWALKISRGAGGDTSGKPGVIFTGVTHAREWITLEVPLYFAKGLVEGYDGDEKVRKRVDSSEIWVIPMVNPDGYEYSREEDSWWRKNRNPIYKEGIEHNFEGNLTPAGAQQPVAIGVDLNRNFHDGNPAHFELWRPKGDLPDNYYDDFSATSDDPRDDTYRGPDGASESEVKSVMNLELSRKNIKGVIDFHAYGEMILYPWAHTDEPVENVETYKALGKKLNDSMGGGYRVMQSCDLYPNSGSSENVHHVNKRMTFTVEMARSFQPSEKDIEPTCKKLDKLCNTFVDWVVDHQNEIPWPDKPPKA